MTKIKQREKKKNFNDEIFPIFGNILDDINF